ncbi:GAF domain-containing protein [Methanothermobacter sp. KEPCO-1]|uniref:Predicted signal transduction protein n=1 Tax=Methanothermobacter marburgensis (strain ATCC BAA-927 / DSM 2133 / JCM 14651 / NBRC 100331 / OCM 82 / Marburg) TaxID=79929 RepID=D9PUA4_METTM|nr:MULTISPECIES: GAF domain-containing protein [Methanothermobacter]ADL57802.1 predicted signal transduction protein [Methanothermobacter marburgensis str. Marburg]QEF94320.1 GAF domain-containing protein [Methanothermobacter sp. KEPCO-1]
MTARILLVEDEAITAMDLQRKLEFQGYDVIGIAHSGEAAVELAEKHRPDLILMDIILRGPMSGVEAAERIKDLDIPVVFLSAHSEESTKYGFHEGYLESIRVSWGEGRYSEGPTGRSIKEGKPVIIRDTENDPSFAPWRDEAIDRGYMSVMGLPIRVRDENIGALTVYSSEKGSFDPEEVELLGELAGDISFRLESEIVLGEMDKRITELERREELFREIFESTPLAILNFRVGDGIQLDELNRAASVLTGLETAGGERIEDVLSGLHEDDLKEVVRAAERGDDSRWERLQYCNGDSVKFLELRTVKTSEDTVTVFLIDHSPAEN